MESVTSLICAAATNSLPDAVQRDPLFSYTFLLNPPFKKGHKFSIVFRSGEEGPCHYSVISETFIVQTGRGGRGCDGSLSCINILVSLMYRLFSVPLLEESLRVEFESIFNPKRSSLFIFSNTRPHQNPTSTLLRLRRSGALCPLLIQPQAVHQVR